MRTLQYSAVARRCVDNWRVRPYRISTNFDDTSGPITSCHCHGRLGRALHCIRDMGFDATDPVEPPPAGDITFAQARQIAGSRLTLIGNMEWTELCSADPTEIRERVKEVLSLGKERLILSTSAGPISAITPLLAENYRAMVEAALEYGT